MLGGPGLCDPFISASVVPLRYGIQIPPSVRIEVQPRIKENPLVIIYTKSICQPCRLSKAAMDRAGVDYEERNIEEVPEYLQEVKSLGYSQAPVVVTPSGEHWSGLRPDLLNTLA